MKGADATLGAGIRYWAGTIGIGPDAIFASSAAMAAAIASSLKMLAAASSD
jgi:hypothetical protein